MTCCQLTPRKGSIQDASSSGWEPRTKGMECPSLPSPELLWFWNGHCSFFNIYSDRSIEIMHWQKPSYGDFEIVTYAWIWHRMRWVLSWQGHVQDMYWPLKLTPLILHTWFNDMVWYSAFKSTSFWQGLDCQKVYGWCTRLGKEASKNAGLNRLQYSNTTSQCGL